MTTPPTQPPSPRTFWADVLADPRRPTQSELSRATPLDQDEIRVVYAAEPGLQPGVSVSVYPVQAGGDTSGYAGVGADSEPPRRRDVTDEETGVVETTWIFDDGSPAAFGPVEWSLRRDLAQIQPKGQLSGTLIASATALAQAMDRAQPDKIAAVGRELREHIRRIEEQAGDDNDTRDYRASLSTPV